MLFSHSYGITFTNELQGIMVGRNTKECKREEKFELVPPTGLEPVTKRL